MPTPIIVYLAGEPALTEEYGLALTGAGCRVTALPVPGAGRRPARSVVRQSASVPRATTIGLELTNTDREQKRRNLRFMDGKLPKGAILVSSSVTVSAQEQAGWIKHPERLLGLAALPSFSGRPLVELAPCVETSDPAMVQATRFFAALGKEIAVVQDRVGLVTPRVVCAIINEACFAVGEQIASAADIDTAMKLGTNYPQGPIEWGNTIGFAHVAAVLEALQRDLGDDRYRIAPVLRQLSMGKPWWST
jgi:3-hydroxybutyryl-CoA dehydrogenase